MLAGHVGVGLSLGRHVSEVSEAIDDLLRRPAADPKLQATAGEWDALAPGEDLTRTWRA